MSQRNQELELFKLNLVAEEWRGNYRDNINTYMTALIAFLAVELTAFIGLELAGYFWYGLFIFLIFLLFEGPYFIFILRRAGRRYDRKLANLNDLVKTVQAGSPIPDLDELLKLTLTDETDEKPRLEKKSKTEKPNDPEAPATHKRDMEQEKLRFAWDYRRSIQMTLLAFVFSATVAIATISNSLLVARSVSPTTVVGVMLGSLVLILYYVLKARAGLARLVIQADIRITELERGKSIESLKELCGFESEEVPMNELAKLFYGGKIGIIAVLALSLFLVAWGLTGH